MMGYRPPQYRRGLKHNNVEIGKKLENGEN